MALKNTSDEGVLEVTEDETIVQTVQNRRSSGSAERGNLARIASAIKHLLRLFLKTASLLLLLVAGVQIRQQSQRQTSGVIMTNLFLAYLLSQCFHFRP
jgi:predicted membrane channel-forming protein YqfA (hemolysin III family)